MYKVANQKIINRISLKSFRANRSRNLIAVAAIVLTTVLFTTLFTLGIGSIEGIQQQTMRQAGGDGHAVAKYTTHEVYEKLKSHPLVEEISFNQIVADSVDNPEFLKRRVEMYYMDDVAMKLGFCEPTTGQKPQKADEIIADTKTLDLLGVPHEIGAKVPLTYTVKGNQVERSFTLCGYWESDPGLNVGFVIVSKAYTGQYSSELKDSYLETSNLSGTANLYIMFHNSFDLNGKLEKLLTDSGFSTDPLADNYLASNVNWSYLSTNFSLDLSTVVSVVSASALILFCGYLIIYNIFQISVLKDIRFYGLLKTIGTTRRQIKRVILRQALLLSVIGIPIGLLLGFLLGKELVPVLLDNTNYGNENLVVHINPLIFIGATVFALLTVFISTRKPGKIAANVSPVEAVRYTGMSQSQKNSKKLKSSLRGGKIYRMAFSNLGRNKKQTVLVIISMSLSLILLNTVFTLSRSFDMNKYLNKFVDTDYLIGHANYFNNLESFQSEEDAVSDSFIEAVQQQPGFEEGGRIYFYTGVGTMDYDFGEPQTIDQYGRPLYQLPNTDTPTAINFGLDNKPLIQLYGMEDLPLSRVRLIQGETDIQKVMEKLKTGDYILQAVSCDDNGNPHLEDAFYQPGDKITIYIDGESHEMEILATFAQKGWADTVRYYGSPAYYLSADRFCEIVSNPTTMSYAYNVSDDAEPSTEAFLKEYTNQMEPVMGYESKQVYRDSFAGLQFTLISVGGVLSFMIGLIGILNFVNSILTSIITRRQEFAMLQSIGMTNRQLSRMLCTEGFYYALFTLLCSFLFGILFSVVIISGIVGNIWFLTYQFIVLPLLLTYPFLILLSIFVPFFSLLGNRKQSIVERLRENDS